MYIIKLTDENGSIWYEKCTSKCGAFYGTPVFTKNIKLAKLITREHDAFNRLCTLSQRYRDYEFERKMYNNKYQMANMPTYTAPYIYDSGDQ